MLRASIRPMIPLIFLATAVAGCTGDKDTEPTSLPVDADGDGFMADEDCDDSLSWVYPDAAEVCDGIDNDCDGTIDEDLERTFYLDADGDGYGDVDSTVESCEVPSGAVSDSSDCDDSEASTHPGATESCDDIDNDCDGTIDEDVMLTFYADMDGDGYGDPTSGTMACELGSGQVENNDDCDDGDLNLHPDAAEICDGIDNDCDDRIDDEDTVDDPDAETFYADGDDDNWGDPDAPRIACEMPDGYVDNAEDCDDDSRMIKPDGLETCDGLDNDCDGLIDDADDSLDLGTADAYYPDADGDGWGAEGSTVYLCDRASGYVVREGDCDDTDDTVYFRADEVCDEIDNDCDGDVDESCSDEEEEEEEESGEWVLWTGSESFAYGVGVGFGDRNCELYWTVEGEAVDAATLATCVDCEFAFDVELLYESSFSYDDGTCVSAAMDMNFSYGYTADYYGYGPYLLYGYGTGTFTPWTTASFDDSTGELEYSYGYEDWDYYGTGTYYTYLRSGEAELSE